jgi:hypothetical protein
MDWVSTERFGSVLGYSHRWGDARDLAFFKPPRTGAVYFLTTVEPV